MGAQAIQPGRPAGAAPGIAARVRAAWVPLTLGAVLLAAAVLRLWGLDAKSLWFDEAYSVFIAGHPLGEFPRLLRASDTHPPLYYALLHLWMGLFGQGEAAVRLPSVLASLGAVGLTYLLARALAGVGVGVLAAGLLAVSPFQITAAQEARMYPLLMLLGLGASYALWVVLAGGGRRWWIAYAGCLGLALYTHHFAFLLLLAHGVYVVGFHRERAATRTWLLAATAVAVAYLPLLPTLAAQIGAARAWPNFRPPFGLRALTDMFGMFTFGGGLFGMGTYFRRGTLPLVERAAILLPFALLVLAGAAGLAGWRRRGFVIVYWLIPIAAVSLASLRWNMFYERYFSFVLPPFVILTAAGVFTVAATWARFSRVTMAATLVVVSAYLVPVLADVYRERTFYNWRGAAAHVAARARSDDLIVFIPPYGQIPFDYYYRGPQVRVSFNPRVLLGTRGPAPGGTPGPAQGGQGRQELARVARRHPRLWIVATIPLGYETRREVDRVLAPTFREVEGIDFGQVFTFLWESRRDDGRDGR